MQRYFPWLMALLACLSLMVSNGMSISGLSVFDESLLGEFGWSRGELKFRDMITLGVTAVMAPVLGVFLDRYGVRACMIVGWVLLIVAYVFYGNIQSLSDMYWVHALLGIVLVLCGPECRPLILVSHWFVEHRGTAIGITLLGSSLGGAFFPQYGTAMIARLGWREAYYSEIVFAVFMLFLTVFVVRSRPVDKGLSAVGDRKGCVDPAQEGMTYGDAIRSRNFWALAVIACTTFYTVLGMQAHIFLHMRDMAFSVQAATNAISLFFMCALVGKFAFGLVADRVGPGRVFSMNLLVMLMGALAVASMSKIAVWAAVVAFGLGWGGVYTVLQLSCMSCFGLRDAGKILGTITVLDATGGGLGIWLTGVLYGSQGDYQLAFGIFCVLVFVALLAIRQVSYPQSDGV